MAPPPRPLPDDNISDILLRISPDDPTSIARSSAVCKAWRRILADLSFSGRYRALHHCTTPVLGFLHHPRDHEAPRFVPTTAPSSSFRLPAADRHERHVWDCRHGRVVLYDYDGRSPTRGFVVWDPITGGQHRIPNVADFYSNAAVICTAGAGCDHRGCSGGAGAPFIVAFAGVEDDEIGFLQAHAEFYSSETRRWSEDISVGLDYDRFKLEADRPAALVGDSLYFVAKSGFLLRYRYGPLLRLGYENMVASGIHSHHVLTVIEPPAKRLGKVIVMTAEGGGLGLACLNLNRIALWAREDDGWVRRRTIDLKPLIPLVNPKRRACLSGVIPEDSRVIFISTEDGVFRIELETLQARKVSDMGSDVKIIYPFVSFFTETLLQRLASGKLPAPVGTMGCRDGLPQGVDRSIILQC